MAEVPSVKGEDGQSAHIAIKIMKKTELVRLKQVPRAGLVTGGGACTEAGRWPLAASSPAFTHPVRLPTPGTALLVAQVEHVKNEYSILRSISHPFIAILLRCTMDERNMHMLQVGGSVWRPRLSGGASEQQCCARPERLFDADELVCRSSCQGGSSTGSSATMHAYRTTQPASTQRRRARAPRGADHATMGRSASASGRR